MKKLFLILFAFVAIHTFAQEKQFVEVTYVMQMDMDAEKVIAQVPQQYRAMVEDQIRQELADGIYIDYYLKTNGNESNYKQIEQISNAQTQGGMIAMQVRTFDKEVTFKDISAKRYKKPIDMMGTKYMIVDTLQDHQWQISREKEEIAGYEARLATGVIKMNDSIIPIKAWYTPKISIKDGPSTVWGLPGLILKTEFTVNDALLTITAKEIAVKEEEIKIENPQGGKEITQSEFEAEMKKMQEQMKEMMEGGVDTE